MWTMILTALIKELESNPDAVFKVIQDLIDLFQKNPLALTTAIAAFKQNTPTV